MRVIGKLALAVVAGGVALGTMLGAAANPVMKMKGERPEWPWQGAMQTPAYADPGYGIMIEAPPQDLSPYQDSYAPTWAHEEVANWEPEYPAWTYADLVSEQPADASPAEEASIDAQQIVTAAEAAAAPEASPEPAAPAEPTQQPAPTAHPRLAAHLDDIY